MENNMKKKKKGFSKKLLIADYAVTFIFIAAFFICTYLNGVYVLETTNKLIEMGMDVSAVTLTMPFNLDGFGMFFTAWITQLGVSSYAYYSMAKSEHKIELPLKLLEDLPEDIKKQIDMTSVITTVLTSTDN
jgi:hypothetical protein